MLERLLGPTQHLVTTPKRKKDTVTTESPTELKLLSDHVFQLEKLVNNLVTSSKDRDMIEKESTTKATETAIWIST